MNFLGVYPGQRLDSTTAISIEKVLLCRFNASHQLLLLLFDRLLLITFAGEKNISRLRAVLFRAITTINIYFVSKRKGINEDIRRSASAGQHQL